MRVNMNIPLTHYDGVFSWDQPTIDRLAQAAIETAVRVGIKLEDDIKGIYLKEAERAGACIDRNTNAVIFSRHDIENVINIMRATAPVSTPLRPPHEPEQPDKKFIVGNGANLLFDWKKWESRAPAVQDLVDLCTFAQGCEDVDQFFAPVMLKDINQLLEPLYNYATTAKYCRKKILHEQATEPIHVKYLDKMARVVEKHRGYFQPMQQWEYINPPFKLGLRSIRTMLTRLDTGACTTVGIGSMAISGMTSPVTIPENTVSAIAEILAALAFFNLVRPGHNLEAVICTGNLNLTNATVSYFNIRTIVQNLAAQELMERGLGVRCRGLSWYRDANEPGMQATYEFGMAQSFFSSVHNYAHPEIGGLACGNTFSPEQALLDMEVIKEFNELTHGFDVPADSPVIDDIINGRFDSTTHMSSEHTLTNMRNNLPFSNFFFRGLSGGARHDRNRTQTDELMDSAAEGVRAATAKGKEIDPDWELGDELFEYVREAAAEIGVPCPSKS